MTAHPRAGLCRHHQHEPGDEKTTARENMGLVDYCSSSSDSDADHDHRLPAKKRRRVSTSSSVDDTPDDHPVSVPSTRKEKGLCRNGNERINTAALPTAAPAAPTALPPLPPSFHDLYATTVRPFTTDLPSLHQGRRRAIPHVAGNWPSHIYVEWHPLSAQHAILTSLVSALAHESPAAGDAAVGGLTSFLTSDLGAPLPLHISLSRPFVLRTEEKDAFHEELVQKIENSCCCSSSSGSSSGGVGGGRGRGRGGHSGMGSFALRVDGLGWFRSPDAERSFLVLRVCSSSATSTPAAAATSLAKSGKREQGGRTRNPELVGLLSACNAVVGAYGQPMLYARGPRTKGHKAASAEGEVEVDDGKEDGCHDGAAAAAVDDGAFHVSIAWSFAEPTADIRARTAAVFAREEFQRGIVEAIRIPVDGVKVKIGNVVTHIALATEERKSSGMAGKGLFGI